MVIDFGRPLPYVHVTSGWWDDRSYRGGVHEGIDCRAAVGTPVLAVEGGRVVRAQKTLTGDPSGLWVGVEHPGGVQTRYMHLSRVDVDVGDRVPFGAVLGLSGRSGSSGMNSTTPHLHYDIRAREGGQAHQEYIARFAIPGPNGFPKHGEWVSLPAEPLTIVHSYEERVLERAAKHGLPVKGYGFGLSSTLFLAGAVLLARRYV